MKDLKIKKSAYALAVVDGSRAELTMYGDIYSSRPTDWNGDPIEGDFILLSDFLDDLDEILFRSDEETDQAEIEEEAWNDIVSEFEGVTA